jgi:hypothetical protein
MKARFAAMFKRVWPVLRWILPVVLIVGFVVFVVSLIMYPDEYKTSGLNKPVGGRILKGEMSMRLVRSMWGNGNTAC